MAKNYLGFYLNQEPDYANFDAEQRQEVILPAQPFTIRYPVDEETGYTYDVDYNPGTQAVTLDDLMHTIYNFYQQSYPMDIAEQLKRQDEIYHSPSETIVDAMGNHIYVERLLSIEPNLYQLSLSS